MNVSPVIVIGAGPQGLAAAAHLAERNVPAVVLEAGDGPAAAVAEWGHVRLFSEWPELVDRAGARLLEPTGWSAPTTGYPTGAQWIAGYLAPLAAALSDRIRYGARVVGVSRLGRDRLVDAGRGEQPFTVHVQPVDGDEYRLQARAVIDASGTWSSPNPAGADGLPALGERTVSDLLSYRIPDFRDREGFEGKHTVVIGSGHSAITAVLALARMARRDSNTTVTWALSRTTTGNAFGGGDADELPARGALGIKAKEFVDAGLVSLVTGFRIERVTVTANVPCWLPRTAAPLPLIASWCSPGSGLTCPSCQSCGWSWTLRCKPRCGSPRRWTRTCIPAGRSPRQVPSTSRSRNMIFTWWARSRMDAPRRFSP